MHKEATTLVKNDKNIYFILLNDQTYKNIYKIPLASNVKTIKPFICFDTLYGTTTNDMFVQSKNIKNIIGSLSSTKPIYYNRFKYVGKGFKLIFKKKKKLFNCIFGYSHIYWVKLQNTLIKKTKKYKFMFIVKNIYNFTILTNILKKIKPINRYTLRGVRTYTHVWIKRKGRKSVATHV